MNPYDYPHLSPNATDLPYPLPKRVQVGDGRMDTLRSHVQMLHLRITHPPRSNAALAREHARQHHLYGSTTHYHDGPNLGPHQRPPGWETGADVVLIN